MFGYIRPVKDKLSEEELNGFRAAYCGLCHCLRRRGGFAASFLINYDFTFLAMLLSLRGETAVCSRRCIAHPFRKRLCRCASESFDAAADMSIILGWLKLRDDINDDGFFRALPSVLASFALRRAFKKACAAQPIFAEKAVSLLTKLSCLEKSGSKSLDETADSFAQVLSMAAGEGEGSRVLSYLFYHVGRLIYILDAIDDLPDDLRSGAYNAVAMRFSLNSAEISQEAAESLDVTIRHSINLIASDFQLLSKTEYSGILSNIIYFGIPTVASEVLRKRLPQTEGPNAGDKNERPLSGPRRFARRK